MTESLPESVTEAEAESKADADNETGSAQKAKAEAEGTAGKGGAFVTAHRVALVAVTTAPLELEVHAEAVGSVSAGAVASFAGIVRNHDHGREVTELEYLAHPLAAETLAKVAAELATAPGVEAVAVSHRVGVLAVGEVALAVAVSAAHRAEAFASCARLVGEIKARVPIWKRQRFGDGSDEWVGCP